MIHLILGTKAQYIKTAPVLWALQREGLPFRIVDTGQHAGWTALLRPMLKIPEPAVFLRTGGDVVRLGSGIRWLAQGWGRAQGSRSRLFSRIFAGQSGIALVHGDTASTWLGAQLAKRAGLPLAHLEAGLRSHRWFSPFPEEWFRQQTSMAADLLLAPSAWAAGNLKRMGVAGRIVNLGANTGLEAVRYSLTLPVNGEAAPPSADFGLASIHRMETLYVRRRLAFVVSALLRAAKDRPILFLLHEPTRRALTRYRLMERIEGQPRIHCRNLVSHAAFLHLLQKSRFVASDGGSVQEESSYLGVPCLLLRERTERLDGLGPDGNVCLAPWGWERVEQFLRSPERYRRRVELSAHSPSKIAVEALRRFQG